MIDVFAVIFHSAVSRTISISERVLSVLSSTEMFQHIKIQVVYLKISVNTNPLLKELMKT